jgi:2-polyprenyl-3-methyl-5-hydroxy-6-metoxy-1,4-benzoquinol methylase
MNTSGTVKAFMKSRLSRAVSALRSPSRETVFSEIYRTNAWRDPESVSGRGSTLARTNVIRSHLPVLLQELNADSLIDAACGDCNWMRYVDLGSIKYIGVDIVPALIVRNRQLYQTDQRTFAVHDITKDRLSDADVILCRDCLIHLSFKSIKAAISNFRKTSATHLLCTTHSTVTENTDCPDGSWRNINLLLPPFNFPQPVKLFVEDAELGKCLGLWRLSD